MNGIIHLEVWLNSKWLTLQVPACYSKLLKKYAVLDKAGVWFTCETGEMFLQLPFVSICR